MTVKHPCEYYLRYLSRLPTLSDNEQSILTHFTSNTNKTTLDFVYINEEIYKVRYTPKKINRENAIILHSRAKRRELRRKKAEQLASDK